MRKGIGVSPGVVVGVAHRVESVLGAIEQETLNHSGLIAAEVERFELAVAESASELETVVHKVAEVLGTAEAEIFKSHLQIVNDPALLSRVRALIENQQLTALSALQVVMNGYAAQLARSQQELFRERMTDIRDVILRIESHLTRKKIVHVDPAGESRNGDESVILVAHEILPSQAMSLGDLPIAGIVTELGGSSSHSAILARSRGIPAVSGVEGILSEVESGDLMIVDGRDGMVLVRPDQEATSAYRKVQREFFNFKDRLFANRDLPAKSADGTHVELLANINNLADAQAATRSAPPESACSEPNTCF